MEKLTMKSRDVVGGNVEKIAALFPHCVTERKGKNGKPELAIDFDKLRAELSNDTLDDSEERYQFTWPDKRAASRLANEPITKTLRPCREESVDFDSTENLYIEGDNLDALKVLRETYLGQVKMIYIDPPYNTGNDFVYNDDFAQGVGEFEQNSGLFDEDGNLTIDPMQRNTEANGRFHTDWLNMIYPRLKVARDLLTEDGVIFISIDDGEQKNIKNLCDEIFGNQNFISQVVWERAFAPINLKKHFSVSHDYVVCYAKNIESVECNGLPRTEESNSRYSNPDNDPRGPWQSDNATVGPAIAEKLYEVVSPSGKSFYPPNGRCWLYTKARFQEMISDNRIWFGENGGNMPRVKRFLSEVKQGITPMSIWKHDEVGHSQDASQKLKKLFDGKAYFDYPKPVGLIERCLQLYTNNDSIILDFFSGSATTAHAVMKLNAEDGGHRRFIMVQLPEVTDEKSEARKAGYETICEIGKERIRRAGKKIKEDMLNKAENVQLQAYSKFAVGKDLDKTRSLWQDLETMHSKAEIANEANEILDKANHLDTGFRVLKLDSSNMEEVFYTPDQFELNDLFKMEDNIKPDRTGEDLLFQVMLNLGVKLSAKIEKKEVDGKSVYCVDNNEIIACFDKDVTESTIEEMAKLLPTHLVIRDASAANDNVLDNFDQIIKLYSSEKKINTHIL